MEDTTITVIGIMIAAIIMFVIPLTLIADRADDISQLVIQTATTEFVDQTIKLGKITSDNYQKFLNTLHSSGNSYEIEMEVKILDKNTSKRVTDIKSTVGTNSYYSIFTSQIEEKIGQSESNTNYNRNGKIILKQGDEISVKVKNSSETLSQTLKSFYYNVRGEDLHIISATASGIIAINGEA